MLGDACHPTLPFLGSGANMALEDGIVLARCLAEGSLPVPARLKRYEAARKERTRHIVRKSAENTGRYHHPDLADPATGKAYIDREWDDQKALKDMIYRYDPVTAAI